MEKQPRPPDRIITSTAPIRICDNGGWTDTWFAEYGKVFNIAVSPVIEVQVAVYNRNDREEQIVIHTENYEQRYPYTLQTAWQHHPLLEATLDHIGLPDDLAIEISIFSITPAGASTGTSAAVVVALIGALDCLTPGRLSPHQIAYVAHTIETEKLGQQAGIQDQLCAAYGGINYINMTSYPQANVSPIIVPPAIQHELNRRLVLIYTGKGHDSHKIHQMVIKKMEAAGPTAPQLEALRQTVNPARDALLAGDFAALGQALTDNTTAQANLHPNLISPEAHQIIEIAQAYGAAGWKVNGAGGDGGSIAILSGPRSTIKRAMIEDIIAENSAFQFIPTHLSLQGLTIWEIGKRK